MSSSSSERSREDALLRPPGDMRRITVSVLLLLPCAALACGEAHDEPAPLDLEGVWTIVGHHAPGVAGTSEMDAEDWRGQVIRLTPARAITARAHCDAPGYAPHLVRRDSFLAAEYKLPADALRRAGLPDRVTVLEVSCGGIPWATMGGRLIGIEPDRALAPWNGIFFEVARESDFRAVGQEPGWLLEIRHARELRLITDYGADTVVAPVPPVGTDPATGARTYHAVTAARDLRVLIQPTACTDAMSGEPYETTVTVTLDGRAYHGCGGPLP
jgi:hypothetical protein